MGGGKKIPGGLAELRKAARNQKGRSVLNSARFARASLPASGGVLPDNMCFRAQWRHDGERRKQKAVHWAALSGERKL